ncbi:PUS3-like protein, partial [Mya arenaria]
MYLGHDYTGYAGTEEAEHTIERELFEALIKCKLIESKESACYSRCGRTDKGVSAFGQLMEEAGKKLIGEYDFRNFSKFNVKNGITNYVRKIMEVEVKTLDETDDGFTMYELTIVGRAFLWHQIRSIFSVLFLVGKGKES